MQVKCVLLRGTCVLQWLKTPSPAPPVQVSWSLCDGDSDQVGRDFGTLRGSARSILVAERVALNLMQRMSGIATATHRMVQVRGRST